jgi:aminoglycoside 3-N-acetyltransferase I
VSDAYIDRLLAKDSFWAFVALDDERIVVGLTAHVLMMTQDEHAELLIYDIAVEASYQRRGIGRSLIESVREEASAHRIRGGLLADNRDAHAVDFYRRLGAADSAVTLFEWDDSNGDAMG